MTRKEEVQIIIKEKARKVNECSQRVFIIDWEDEESENTEKLLDYREKLDQAIQYIDELETLSK